jgi:uncharacterized oxidoreductase
MDLKNKTILITGGNAGIGLEAARQFLGMGLKVIITGRNQDKIDTAKKMYPNLITIKSDAANAEDALSLYNKVKELGGIDILYNNAGVLRVSSNLGMQNNSHLTDAEYEMNINYYGVVRLNNLFIEMLKSRKESAIINTTSLLAYVPSVNEATYSASKVALHFYTETLRKHLEVIESNVKVFELLPPVVKTEMTVTRNDKKLTPEVLVKALIIGLKKNHFTIRVGDTKLIYIINRLMPKLAFRLVNSKESLKQLSTSNNR